MIGLVCITVFLCNLIFILCMYSRVSVCQQTNDDDDDDDDRRSEHDIKCAALLASIHLAAC